MRITSLSVKHVRTHTGYDLPLHPLITLITGVNGSGKTSLLEAVFIALQGSSFKGSDNEVLQNDAPWYRIDIKTDQNTTRTVKFDPGLTSGKKQFEIDTKTQYRLTHANKYPVVLFDPDELRLIHGSPARRRRFVDGFISQFDPEYAMSLHRYERALKQRNTLLKSQPVDNNLFVWDVSLSKYGAYITEKRIELINRLYPGLKSIYKDIAHTEDTVVIDYSDRFKSSIEQKLLSELHQSANRDRMLGYTSVGPHRHDILFTLNSGAAASSASRGETRTIVLALKFLEVAILREETGKDPVILLDDVFSELDKSRQEALLERFSEYQTIITSVIAPKTSFPVHELPH